MKSFLSFVCLLLFSISIHAQESGLEGEGISIGKREVAPSLSFLAPEIPSQNLTLTEINWNPVQKREVNFVAMMEREKAELENSYIQLDSPVPGLGKTEKAMIQVTNDFRRFDKGSNYDLFTGEKKIPAYKEMRAGLFHGVYSPYSGRSSFAPYYSPLR